MDVAHELSNVAAMFADRSRATFLSALHEGDGLPLTDLARRARVSVSTASTHMSKLVDAGLVEVEALGRHRYYRLAHPAVADAIESLIGLVSHSSDPPVTRAPSVEPTVARARTCFDHLAGRLGVALTDSLIERHVLETRGSDFTVTSEGADFLLLLEIDVEALSALRRAFARRCLDWTERRYHLGGALGAALASSLLERKWIRRSRGSRALYVTDTGNRGLQKYFDLPFH